MRCSKCGYVGFAHLESCLGCGALLNLPATGGTPLYLGQSALDISPGPDLKIPLIYGEAPEGLEEEPPSIEEAPPEEAEPEAQAPEEEVAPPPEQKEEPEEAPASEQKEEEKKEEALPDEEDLEALWAQPVEEEEEGEEAAPEGEKPPEAAAPQREGPPEEAEAPAPPAAESAEEVGEEEKVQEPEPLSPEEVPQGAAGEAVSEEKGIPWEVEEDAPPEPAEPGVAPALSLPGEPVGFGRRVLAAAIDLILLLLITFLFAAGTFVILKVDLMSLRENLRAILVFSSLNLGFLFVLSLLYTLFFLGAGGQTIGAMVLGFEVVRGDGSPLGYRRALLRYLGFLLSCLPLFLGLLIALADRQGRALHDRLSGTIPVMAR
ncbi:MAG: RDD family protein [Nitrospinota bacterium]